MKGVGEMGEDKYANNPLLYISQPDIKTPQARMQNHYVTQTTKKKNQQNRRSGNKPLKRHTFPVSARRRRLDTDRLMEERTPHESNADDDAKTIHDNTHQRSKFKNVTINEKVANFDSRARHIPKIKCKNKTSEKTYGGIITEFNHNTVIIQQGTKHTPETVAFADIEEVHMLGL